MLVLVALAVLEELLWDALVFRDYLPALCRNMTAAPPAVEAATHGGLRLASRFGGRAFERSYEADERSARRGGGWLCDRLWGEEEGDASAEGDKGEWEGGEPPLLDLGATGVALATAALATPQIVHYVLDGYCSRLDRSPHQPRTARHHPRGAAWPVALHPLRAHPPPATPHPFYRYIWRFDLNPRLREYLFAGEAPGAGAGAPGAAGEGAQMAEAKEGKGESFHRPDSHPPLTAEQIAAAAAAWRAARPAAASK